MHWFMAEGYLLLNLDIIFEGAIKTDLLQEMGFFCEGVILLWGFLKTLLS